jgi:hypothetical protein
MIMAQKNTIDSTDSEYKVDKLENRMVWMSTEKVIIKRASQQKTEAEK